MKRTENKCPITTRPTFIWDIRLKDGCAEIETEKEWLELDNVSRIVINYLRNEYGLRDNLYIREGVIGLHRLTDKIMWERQKDGTDWIYIYI